MTHDRKTILTTPAPQQTSGAPTAPQLQQRPLTPTEQAEAFLKARAETSSAFAALQAVKPQARGRLIFAMDATASREPTWELARELTAAMFEATAGLQVKLAYYGGTECKHSAWKNNPGAHPADAEGALRGRLHTD
jgi:hypothetical protein